MIRKLTLAAGFGAGYVLGAKAGKERYAQIEAKVRELAGLPAVQDMTATLADTASTLGDKAKAAVNETVANVADTVSGDSTVDLTKSKPKASRTTPPPAPGAAATVTAPPVVGS